MHFPPGRESKGLGAPLPSRRRPRLEFGEPVEHDDDLRQARERVVGVTLTSCYIGFLSRSLIASANASLLAARKS